MMSIVLPQSWKSAILEKQDFMLLEFFALVVQCVLVNTPQLLGMNYQSIKIDSWKEYEES